MTKVKKKKKARLQYPKENVLLAVKEVKEGETIGASSRKFQVPESTIRAKISNKYADKKPGPSSFLSSDQEQEIVDWIFQCS